MGIVRIIFLLIIFAIIYWGWKLLRNKLNPPQPRIKNIQSVRCSYCGVHIAQSQAISDQSEWFCSERHRDAKKLKK